MKTVVGTDDLFLSFSACRKWGRMNFLLLPAMWERKFVQVHYTLYLIVTWKGKHINRALTLKWHRTTNVVLAPLHGSQKLCQSLGGNVKGHSNTMRKTFFYCSFGGSFLFLFDFWVTLEEVWGERILMVLHNTDSCFPLYLNVFCRKYSITEMCEHHRAELNISFGEALLI